MYVYILSLFSYIYYIDRTGLEPGQAPAGTFLAERERTALSSHSTHLFSRSISLFASSLLFSLVFLD